MRLARRGLFVGLAATFVLLPVRAAARSDHPATRTTTVRVTMREFRFKLSRGRVPVGRVRLVVHNAGLLVHDLAIAGRRTRRLARGRNQTLIVTFRKSGRYAYHCTVPGHAAVGMKGVLLVGTAKPKPKPKPKPPPSNLPLVTPTKIGDFTDPVDVVAPPGDSRRLLVVNKSGLVQELLDGQLQAQPFLDLRKVVQSDIENGMLKLVFAPDYATSGRLYVYFNDRVGNKNANLVEFRRSAVNPETADPGTWRQILSIVKPWTNHNGGMLEFGSDGYLYVSVGDGDSGVLHKPGAFAQTRNELLGDILRIDPLHGDPYTVPASNPFVGVPGVRPEIWAYGLRNPWRFWIDTPTATSTSATSGSGRRRRSTTCRVAAAPARTSAGRASRAPPRSTPPRAARAPSRRPTRTTTRSGAGSSAASSRATRCCRRWPGSSCSPTSAAGSCRA